MVKSRNGRRMYTFGRGNIGEFNSFGEAGSDFSRLDNYAMYRSIQRTIDWVLTIVMYYLIQLAEPAQEAIVQEVKTAMFHSFSSVKPDQSTINQIHDKSGAYDRNASICEAFDVRCNSFKRALMIGREIDTIDARLRNAGCCCCGIAGLRFGCRRISTIGLSWRKTTRSKSTIRLSSTNTFIACRISFGFKSWGLYFECMNRKKNCC